MNEIALENAFHSESLRKQVFGTRETRLSPAFYGYSLLIICIGLGWLLREREWINAEHGLGYWLGIVGGSMMLLLLVYPLRKRLRVLSLLGSTRMWFRLHMILGLLGPLLVLYHSNFQLGSFNSRVALYCMLLVAGSGIIGRYLYAHVHRGLYGRRTTLAELSKELSDSLENNRGVATILPDLTRRLERLAAQMRGDAMAHTLSGGEILGWNLRRIYLRFSLRAQAIRELRNRAALSPPISRNYPRLRKTVNVYLGNYLRLLNNVVQFSLYEKLLSAWHILHLPLFLMMVISALVHVLAVHMY